MTHQTTPGNIQAQAIDLLLDSILTDTDFRDFKYLKTAVPTNYRASVTGFAKFLAVEITKRLDNKIMIAGAKENDY